MVHGSFCGVGSAEINELCDEIGVVLEMGLNGVSLNLFEVCEIGAFGYERKDVR